MSASLAIILLHNFIINLHNSHLSKKVNDSIIIMRYNGKSEKLIPWILQYTFQLQKWLFQ